MSFNLKYKSEFDMTIEKIEVNKKQVCFDLLATLVVVEDGVKSFSMPRKEILNLMHQALLDAGVDKYDIKPNLATSYYQMGRMEYITGNGAYKHHKGAKAKTDEDADVEPEVIIPEGSQWQAVKDDVIEYFKNRQAATAFVGKNGGKDAWEVTKLAS